MQNSDQEIVRRVLSNVLTRLERPVSAQPSPGLIQATASEGGPIIFIVLGNAEQARENVEQVFDERDRQLEAPEGKMTQTQAPSPELERFASLEAQQNNFAPKTCFMEPDRVCVNSGACQMRGY